MKYLESREPLTKQEVIDMLNEHVESVERRWGKDDFWSKQARESRDRNLDKYMNGEVVQVKTVNYSAAYGNGTGDYTDVLYSDGHVETWCYGYID